MKKRWSGIFLFLILILGFAVRLYKIDNPIADWQSWRQADTAAVARNFVKTGFDPLHPRYDDLSNVQSGKDNPQGWRMVEFPLYQSLGYFGYKIYPKLSIEIYLRLISIIMSLITSFCLYSLVRKYLGSPASLLTAAVYTFLPFSIYYSRSILPDTMAVSLAITAVWLCDKSINNKNKWLFLSMIFASLSLLVKPMAGFLLLPILYLLFKNYGVLSVVNPFIYLYGFITLMPILIWRFWIAQFPEGIPAYTWLFNEGNTRTGGAFYRWIIAERLGKLILGYLGFIPLALGLILKPLREKLLFIILFISSLLYLIVFARGNLQHDYYQIILIPVLAVFTGKGLAYLFSFKNSDINRLFGVAMGIFCFFGMIIFSWYEVKGYFWINHPEIVEAGQAVDRLTPSDAKVIAPYGGDTAFLYQTNRQGWPVLQKPIDEMIKMGATHIVIANPDAAALSLSKTYTLMEQKDKYALFDLKKAVK